LVKPNVAFSFMLQPTSGFVQQRFSGGYSFAFQGFVPHSAVIAERVNRISRIQRSPSSGFFNPSTGSSFLSNLRVYSTPLALPGFCLQSFPAKRWVSLLETPASSLLALLHGFLQSANQILPDILTAPDYLAATLTYRLPLAVCTAGFHLGS
jgi:hypothetical protein